MADSLYFALGLLMSMEGANNSTTFTDYSPLALPFTAQGAAKISTSQFKYGSSALSLDGSASWIETSRAGWAAFGSGDFTIEFWIKTADSNAVIMDAYNNSGLGWQVTLTSTGKIAWWDGVTGSYIVTGAVTVNDNAWHHVALSRGSGTLKLFIDGAADGSVSNSTNFSQAAAKFAIGAQVINRNATFDLSGYVDDARITRGVARYTAAFTAPSALDTSTLAVALTTPTVPMPVYQYGFPALSYKAPQAPIIVRDMEWGGSGRISGTTKIKGTPDVPVKRRVRLHRERDGLLIREMWSDATTGAYSFDNVNANEKYTVVTFDYQHNFRAVIADNQTPSAMP